jgi:hypothetical protein
MDKDHLILLMMAPPVARPDDHIPMPWGPALNVSQNPENVTP